jgi:phosphatidylinositol-3-phosphatase
MPRFSRVIVVVMENKEYGSIIGNSNAPYINSLADDYSLATQFYGVTHPSLPDYLAVTGGSTFGITSNCTDCHVNAPNITTQLEHAGISWKAYIEGLPAPCSNVAEAGDYSKKHNPFMYYDDIVNDPTRCKKVVPLTQLDADRRNGKLPQFVWVTPDMCHDMHDCTVKAGDEWLSRFVPPLLRTLGSRGVLFLTFDEGASDAGCCRYAAGGHIATVVAGPAARSRTKSSTSYSLYSLLRVVENSWRLGLLGRAGCSCTADMRALIDSA